MYRFRSPRLGSDEPARIDEIRAAARLIGCQTSKTGRRFRLPFFIYARRN
jgi:hypothetical protein